jgi:hypothetical protein
MSQTANMTSDPPAWTTVTIRTRGISEPPGLEPHELLPNRVRVIDRTDL